jgi:hypothetical protein
MDLNSFEDHFGDRSAKNKHIMEKSLPKDKIEGDLPQRL